MTLKILIVDDIQSWRNFNAHLIRALFKNTEIHFASSASEAYNTALVNMEHPYDIILTDLQMESDYEPDHAGQWFVRELKLLKQYKNTFIIIISASSDIRYVTEKLGVEYIPKSTLVHSNLALQLKLEELGIRNEE